MDLIENLRRAPLFSRLSEWHLEQLARICEEHTVPADTRLCRQADLGATFFLIDSGEAVLHRVDERGLQRPVGVIRGGESFGATSLFLGEPRDATVTAVTEMHLWTIRRRDFQQLLDDHPAIWRELLIPSEILDKLHAPRYPWLDPGELVSYHCRRHWVVFVQKISFSTLFFLGFLALVIWLTLRSELQSYGFVFPAVLLYGLLLLWHWTNWRNDYFAVTNYRITHRERVTFLYESRLEAPVDRVQNIQVVTGFLGQLLHFGDLTIETAAEMGSMRFDRIPWPERMREAIWSQLARARAVQRAVQRQLIREALATHMDLDIGEISPEALPGEQEPVDYRDLEFPEIRPGPLARALLWLAEREMIPCTRIETDDGITWRKHWAFLMAETLFPLALAVTLMVLTVLGFFGLPAEIIEVLPQYPYGALFGAVLALGWLWWQYSDWENDLYIVTNERIIDIEKRPLFFSEQRREASLGMIQNVYLEVPNILASLLNYGDVIVQTAGAGDFTFSNVADPHRVQREIFQRMRAFQEAQREKEAARRRAEIAEWFSVYDELRTRGQAPYQGVDSADSPSDP